MAESTNQTETAPLTANAANPEGGEAKAAAEGEAEAATETEGAAPAGGTERVLNQDEIDSLLGFDVGENEIQDKSGVRAIVNSALV